MDSKSAGQTAKLRFSDQLRCPPCEVGGGYRAGDVGSWHVFRAEGTGIARLAAQVGSRGRFPSPPTAL